MGVVKVCGEEVSEAEYESAVKAFKEINEEVLDDPTLKSSKAYLAVIKVKMKKPWVSITSAWHDDLNKRGALRFFIDVLEEGGMDDLFEVEIREVEGV